MKETERRKPPKLLIPLILCFILLLGVIGGTTAKYVSEQEVGGGTLTIQCQSIINRLWQDKLTFTPVKVVVDTFENAKGELPAGTVYDDGIDIGADGLRPEYEGQFASNVKLFQGNDGTAYILSRGSNTPYFPMDSQRIFRNLTEVTQIDFRTFDTSHVVNMASFFSMCKNLTSLDLSKFNTSNVQAMPSMVL